MTKLTNMEIHDVIVNELIAAQDMAWIGGAYSEMGLKGLAKATAGMTDYMAQKAGARFLDMAGSHAAQARALAKAYDMKMPKLDARQERRSKVPLTKTAIKMLMAHEWNSARAFASELTNMHGWDVHSGLALVLNDARQTNLHHHLWLKRFAKGQVT
jgi:hypothetical protein